MKHVMIDIETLGTDANAAILAIGAIRFDPDTGETGDSFFGKITLSSNIDVGRTVDSSTLEWWLKQSDDARRETFFGDEALIAILTRFSAWLTACERPAVYVWGNGSDFDIALLSNAFQGVRMPIPWQFWNARDVRTMVHLTRGAIKKTDVEFEGTKHNAFCDALHQARYVSLMWQHLRRARGQK